MEVTTDTPASLPVFIAILIVVFLGLTAVKKQNHLLL